MREERKSERAQISQKNFYWRNAGTMFLVLLSYVYRSAKFINFFARLFFFFVWADLVIRYKVLLLEATPQCHHREPSNQVHHLEGGTGDRKLVCDRPLAPLLRTCSSSRAPSLICALLSGTVQRQYVGGLV